MVVKKGTRISIMASSLHYNREPSSFVLAIQMNIVLKRERLGVIAMYWEDPYTFDPSRFIDTPEKKWNREACELLPCYSFSRIV